jgi:hypothetical protein
MSGSNNGKYIALKFTHEEINNCILKVNNGMVLSKDQYNKLVNEIGIDNISTFNGDYNTLKNLPVIPTKLSQLENDLNLQGGNQVIENGLSEDEVFVLIENAIVDKADKQQLEDMSSWKIEKQTLKGEQYAGKNQCVARRNFGGNGRHREW